jgi:transcriptional regulator with XRE-family HTH domain
MYPLLRQEVVCIIRHMDDRHADAATAANIRAYREQLGWSRRQLAEHSGLSENTIENIERNRRPVTVGDVMAVATAFGVNVYVLLPVQTQAPSSERLREETNILMREKARLALLQSSRLELDRQIAEAREAVERQEEIMRRIDPRWRLTPAAE